MINVKINKLTINKYNWFNNNKKKLLIKMLNFIHKLLK